MLTQARTGKIRLKDFLFKQHVLEVASPLCTYWRMERETVEHLVLRCGNVDRQRRTWLQEQAQPLCTGRDLVVALQCPRRAKLIAKWVLSTGRLREYKLAVEVLKEENREEVQGEAYSACRSTRQLT